MGEALIFVVKHVNVERSISAHQGLRNKRNILGAIQRRTQQGIIKAEYKYNHNKITIMVANYMAGTVLCLLDNNSCN